MTGLPSEISWALALRAQILKALQDDIRRSGISHPNVDAAAIIKISTTALDRQSEATWWIENAQVTDNAGNNRRVARWQDVVRAAATDAEIEAIGRATGA